MELKEKGNLELRFIPFLPERTVRSIKGTLKEIADSAQKNGDVSCQDYVKVILTDEETVDSPKDYLERYYGHILEITIDNSQTRQILEENTADIREMTPLEAFEGFFCDVMGRPMKEGEERAFREILGELED